MKKHTYIIAFTLFTLLFSACGNNNKQAATDNTPAIKVHVNAVKINNNTPFLTVSGKIQATESADLSTRFMGYVNKIHVEIGDQVNQGQLLVSINNSDLEAKRAQVNAGISEATVAYNNAKRDFERFTNLFASKSISQKEMDNVAANYEMAKARLEAAKGMKNEINAQFEYANITAPFSGIITNKYVKSGDMANPGMPLISLENPKQFEILAMVPESEISQINKGITVSARVKSVEEELKGTVAEISSSARHTGGQYLVKITLEKPSKNVLSGMFATVLFPVEKQQDSNLVLIPQEAIVNNGQLTGVYTVSATNTALLRWLRLGRTYGDQVEVLSGLNSEESYIISAEGKLYNGAKISIQ
ncbi:efflux RND transporter periplasmic adaptor subunit [Gaetbulibacter saemankumensis]|uniref:efflux RND transporter periplasmic adaptor subunit n=1 Tax=Gaetbulibacter saemankumensis TaxID=311208 RepID=UPI0004212724|nr:efflux RND transporter periplasmic adaptor subunit [Gaetbulibacter saemankumensis]